MALAVGCGSKTASPPPATTTVKKPLTFAQLIAHVRSGIVRMEVTTCDGSDIGTGFLVSDRLVATVDHVVDGAVRIDLKQNGKVVAHGTVIGSDGARDLALVRTDKPVRGHHFTIASRAPQLGDDVAAIGFPLGLPLTVTRGSVSGLDRTIPIEGLKRRSLVQTDAAVNPGNSGGPLITDTGNVVGLVDLGTDEANGLAFAVSAQVAKPLLQAWQAAPQPISAATCAGQAPQSSQAAAPPSSSGGSSSANAKVETYNGTYFSIIYPAGFAVTSAEQDMGTYYDTTIESGDYLIRIDESPQGSASVDQAIAPELRTLRAETGYVELGLVHTTFEGYPAIQWEFEVPENGVLLHKIDLVFTDAQRRDWAILTQSPASEWSKVSAALDAISSSFVETGR
ncbi:MAG TPA: S1C family serine protease [Gaiellaceae bacterium]|nr:S1C family serine protease [Gaiellaceae bacterium]